MIASWKEFFIAVEQMRLCQKEYARGKDPGAYFAAKKCEAAVDACIAEKRSEWELRAQPELNYKGAVNG
jgi:hypothetical protein